MRAARNEIIHGDRLELLRGFDNEGISLSDREDLKAGREELRAETQLASH
ncbi:MAG TPA: hypothetical protein VK993_04225 [Chthoniobacterales bacterium]|nr:hypothetical protein [Chthoniobacterales bacterium]